MTQLCPSQVKTTKPQPLQLDCDELDERDELELAIAGSSAVCRQVIGGLNLIHVQIGSGHFRDHDRMAGTGHTRRFPRRRPPASADSENLPPGSGGQSATRVITRPETFGFSTMLRNSRFSNPSSTRVSNDCVSAVAKPFARVS